MNYHCVKGHHGECPDTARDSGSCSCPCHLTDASGWRRCDGCGATTDPRPHLTPDAYARGEKPSPRASCDYCGAPFPR